LATEALGLDDEVEIRALVSERLGARFADEIEGSIVPARKPGRDRRAALKLILAIAPSSDKTYPAAGRNLNVSFVARRDCDVARLHLSGAE